MILCQVKTISFVKMDDQDPGWIAYDKREGWKDVTPVYQTETERSVINIAYSQKCG